MKIPASLSLMASVALLASQAAWGQVGAPQGPPPRPRFGGGGANRDPGMRFEQRLAQRLGLNADQQNKVHTALAEGRVLSQGTGEKLHTLHMNLNAAIKNGDEASIDKISADIANLHQQQVANSAKTTAKIYSTLTADQKTQVGDDLEMLGGGGPGFGRGFGPSPGPRARRPPLGEPQ